jgi:predicted transglutaminase-like cysteine proteinase
MTALEYYLYAMEASEETLAAQGLIVTTLTVAATGTCGVTTPETGLRLPTPTLEASADWLPVGVCDLPAPAGSAAQEGWHPAWSDANLPLPDIAGQASVALLVDVLLTPLFYEAEAGSLAAQSLPLLSATGATGAGVALTWPLPRPYGLSGLDRVGGLACALPGLAATAWSCGLDDPVGNAATSDAVVALLCRDMAAMAQAATALADGATLEANGADALAGALLAAVAAHLAYVADADDDVWTCAMGTYGRGTGDCEDGAILLHGLLLAAGVASNRLVTAFGRVGVARSGHAWVTYRRGSDGNWVVLDWTATTGTAVASLPSINDVPYYALVDHVLTAEAFFTVRQTAASFFPKANHVPLTLPAPVLSATATLGGRAACTLTSDSIQMTALAAATGRGRLAVPSIAAKAGANRLTARFSALTAKACGASRASLALPVASGAGQALGLWARAGLTLQASLEAAASLENLGRGQVQLGRTRLTATGLSGHGGTGHVAWPRVTAVGRALPGRLSHGRLSLASPDLSGLGLATDPGQAAIVLPDCLVCAVGGFDQTVLDPYRWQTASQELW